MNKLKAIFYQFQNSKEPSKVIGFKIEQSTNAPKEEVAIIAWLGGHLAFWYANREYWSKQRFILSKPIIIKVYWNNTLAYCFTQHRVDPKSNNERQEWHFPIRKGEFVLRPYSLDPHKNTITTPSINPDINTEWLFNTVEYFSMKDANYGSPILYTGMTN